MKVLVLLSILSVGVLGARNVPGGRIVNGAIAAAGQFPFQVLVIGYPEDGSAERLCGGSLISTEYILTAASCVVEIYTFNLGFGSNSLSTPLVTRNVTYVKPHDDYNPVTFENDIALIYVSTPVELSATIQLINLPHASQLSATFTNEVASVAGWGRIADASPNNSEDLRYVQVRVIDNLICSINYPANVVSSTLCARGYEFNAQSICNGDFGSALAIQDDDSWTQIGIASFISFERGCASGYPSGYARITSFIDWIANNTGIVIQP